MGACVCIPGGVGNLLGHVLTTAKLWNSLTEQNLQRTVRNLMFPNVVPAASVAQFCIPGRVYMWILGTISYNPSLQKSPQRTKKGGDLSSWRCRWNWGWNLDPPPAFVPPCQPYSQLLARAESLPAALFSLAVSWEQFLCPQISSPSVICSGFVAKPAKPWPEEAVVWGQL